jgi:hypothetical protein
LRNHERRQQKNLEAEESAVRSKLWGSSEMPANGSASESDEDMGDRFILGDNNIHPTPIVIPPQPQSSGLGKVLAGAALGASLLGIPGAGVAGYLLSQSLKNPPVSQAQPTEDKSLDLGLLRIDDLKPKE